MNCSKCNYALWNLPGRQCPECGQAYKLSDYYFQPYKVEFCCPHCQHVYLGSGEKGQPTLPDDGCEGCGKPLQMDELIVRPLDSSQTALLSSVSNPCNPWMMRSELGLFRAFFRTAMMSLFEPTRLARGVSLQNDAGMHARRYFGCVLGVIIASKLLVSMVLVVFDPNSFNYFAFRFVIEALVVSLLLTIGLMIQGLISHAVIILTSTWPVSFEVTRTAMYYSSTPVLIGVLPCCCLTLPADAMIVFGIGLPCTLVIPLLMILWHLSIASTMIAELGRASSPKAAAAVLAGPAIMVFVFLFALLFLANQIFP